LFAVGVSAPIALRAAVSQAFSVAPVPVFGMAFAAGDLVRPAVLVGWGVSGRNGRLG